MSKGLTLLCCLSLLAVCIAIDPDFELDERDANVDDDLIDDNSTDPTLMARVFKAKDFDKLSPNSAMPLYKKHAEEDNFPMMPPM